MNQIKEIALKLFELDKAIACQCNAEHEICLSCNKCRANYDDQIVKDYERINNCIDHTILRANATYDDVLKLCDEAKTFDFKSVCINPSFIKYVGNAVLPPFARGGGGINPVFPKICTVIGFPLGANISDVKLYETKNAIENGATEIDMVINISKMKSINSLLLCPVKSIETIGTTEPNHKEIGDFCYKQEIFDEISQIATICKNNNTILKVIIETCLLTRDEIIIACLLSKKAGADFVKTSTGFSIKGAEIDNVELMRRVVGSKMGVKASGGIKTKADAMAMLKAGANRLGTSNSVEIMNE